MTVAWEKWRKFRSSMGEAGALSWWNMRRGIAICVYFLAVTTLVVFPPAGHASTSTDAVQSDEVQAYSESFSVPSSVARERLEVQTMGTEADIVEDLERQLDESFAGVWFDNSSSEFVVPVAHSASRSPVAAVLRSAGLGARYRTVGVTSSWDQLEKAQLAVNLEMQQLFESGLVRTWLDPRTNAVIVDVAGDAEGRDVAEIKGLVARAPVQVELRSAAQDTFATRALSCKPNFLERYCDRSLRGGVGIEEYEGEGDTEEPLRTCTAAFRAKEDGTNARTVLTAGHCIDSPSAKSPPFLYWSSADASQHSHYIGEVTQHTFLPHDWAKINANGSYWDVMPWPSTIAYWGENKNSLVNENYAINGEASSYLFQTVCHSGASTGTSCGNVIGLNQTIYYEGDGWVTNMTNVYGGCIAGGDSGGPVFANHIALGILSGGEIKETNGEQHSCYEPEWDYANITEATSALGVHVAPEFPGPSATTANVTNVNWNRATLNGTVSPNGLSTTYYFQYGPTSSYGNATGAQSTAATWGPVSVNANTGFLNPSTTYHYRLVASNSAGTAYGSDQTFTTASAGVFFSDAPDNNTMTNWSYSSSNGWQQEFLYGHPIAAGTSPATVKVNGLPNVFFVDSSNNNTITDWSWNPSTGWQQTYFYGHSVAAGTSPSAVVDAKGVTHVYFVDASNSNTISEWNSAGGWHQGFLYGHPAAAKSSPSAIAESNGTVHVYFVDASNSNTITEWNSEGSWHQAFLWGHSAAAGTSPSGVMNGVTPEVYFVDANNSNTITNWSSYGGWHQTFLYGHAVMAKSSPSASRESNGTVHVYFADASDSNTITEWNSAGGWHQTFFWGHSVASGSSPYGLMNGVTPEVYFVDANNSSTITNWSSYGGWHQTFLYGHAVSANSGPAGL